MTRLQEIPWVEKVTLQPTAMPKGARVRLPWRVDLYRVKWLRPLIASRWPQLLLRVLILSGFVFAIAGGLIGSLVGSHNFAIIFVWIAWWTALKLVFIPLGGRSWCSVCPIPLPGEWLQQGGILKPGAHKLGLNIRFPKRLKGSWMQSGSFLLIGMFSALTLTDPRVTGWVLLGIFTLAIGMSIIFDRRPFCTSLCPIGGFSGMYAQTAPLEVRIIDKDICATHAVKSCYQACPWGVYPVALRDNSTCAQCMECLRACPHDNLALNLRPFGADLQKEHVSSRLDEAFMVLVMLGSVLTFTAVFTGPWGWLKLAAFEIGSASWFGYAAGYLALNLLLLPACFALAVWANQKFTASSLSLRRSVATYARALIPLGLMAWIAFTVSFAFPKLDTILMVMNDPFGWGWKLLGGLSLPLTMRIAEIGSGIQLALLLVGLYWSASISLNSSPKTGKPSSHLNLPVIVFSFLFSLVMLWLLLG